MIALKNNNRNSSSKAGVDTLGYRTLLPWTLLLGILYLSGCSPWIKTKQILHDRSFLLQNGKTIGQTFQSRYDGLQGISIYIEPDQAGSGEVILEIKSSPQSSQILANTSIPTTSINTPDFYHFTFPPVQTSQNQFLYAEVSMSGLGTLIIGGSSGRTYLNGALYRNGEPLDAQLAFNLSYQPFLAILGVLSQSLEWIAFTLAGFFLLILPGWALMTWGYPGWSSLHWGVKLGLSAGISVSLFPIIYLWTNILKLNLGPIYSWLISVGAILGIIWKNRLKITRVAVKSINVRRLQSPDFALIIVILLILVVRFWPVRNLDIPMWGDSYQHSLITQLMIDNGGLFQSWEPYARLDAFTYHFGFHATTAAFHWITGLPAPQSVLWMGQIINGLAIFSLIPLAVRLGGSNWAGVAAVVVAGLLSPMPMFYVNWGRYTQLASQIILPVLAFIAWDALRNKNLNRNKVILTILVMSGLALTHYRVAIFGMIFFIAYFLANLRLDRVRNNITRISLIGVGSGVVLLPWIVRVLGTRLSQIFTRQVTTSPVQSADNISQLNAIGDLSPYLPDWIWYLLPLILGWGIWRRNRGVILVSLWWAMIFLAANPQWFRLPGAGVLTAFAVLLGAYIPAGILLGASLSWGIQVLQLDSYSAHTPAYLNISSGKARVVRRLFSIAGILVFISISLIGGRQRLRDVQPRSFALVTIPDLKGMEWIDKNIPTDTRFLVNSFSAFGGSTIAGSDAGWWLPLLARRDTNLPPMVYFFENDPRPNYREEIAALNQAVATKNINDPDLISLLRAHGITHIYIGQQQGTVGYGVTPSLKPDEFASSQFYNLLYHQDRVWIFELVE